MEILDFIATVILVTASGALAPGPLFFANLSIGTRRGAKSGAIFSIAHTLVEFSLVMLLTVLLLILQLLIVASELVKIVIGIAGGVVLIAFGILQIYSSLRPRSKSVQGAGETNSQRLLLIGLAFTGLNPFFIIWWLTAGAQLIIISWEFASLAGVFLMYICHVWMDYVWLTVTAHLAKMGTDVVELKWYKLIMILFSGVLIYFGITFLIGSIMI